ncbi:ankyrin repeat-containing protein, putative [Ricinus communis]|uniref:Ankyrin repeat-containing protein, putative n=1 Tax=Ricinus communis TaxID=3988 RepID=B9RGX5_RICCO|nr:ankyrin repeat-containing protein, putative [Ricinus communis]
MDPELYKAAKSGNISFAEANICDEESPFLFQTTPTKNNLLHVAAEFKQTNFFKTVCLKCRPSLIWQQNSEGDTPFHVAARVGCPGIVDFLIEQASSSADIESRGNGQFSNKELIERVNGEMDTALHHAVRNGHFEVVKSLIAAHPELTGFVNIADESPRYLAVFDLSSEIAMLILDSCQSSFSYKGTNGVTALHLLASVRTEGLASAAVLSGIAEGKRCRPSIETGFCYKENPERALGFAAENGRSANDRSSLISNKATLSTTTSASTENGPASTSTTAENDFDVDGNWDFTATVLSSSSTTRLIFS